MSDPKRWLDDPTAPGQAVRLVAVLRSPETFSRSRPRIRFGSGWPAPWPTLRPQLQRAKLGPLKLAAASGVVIGAGVLVAYFVSVGGGEPAPDSASAPVVTAPAPKPPAAPVAEVAPVVEQPADETRTRRARKARRAASCIEPRR